ncbi:Na(+)/H(+) antiporter subunit B [Zhongshania antarctica]|uniref:Na(+)/H(+) antiporter subunit B n=1 Tax=Zhongshania antarctica TaxID=641702 RepID=UPI001D03A684|nr:Na(+)/H(+) antiporter subunit B [Zhongshania antarctica]
MDLALLSMLFATAIGIVLSRDLIAVVMLTGIYGFLSASFFVLMDAVDVAFTEAAVGAGISPLLMLLTLAMVGRKEQASRSRNFFAFILVTITGALLIIATFGMPEFGSATAPAHTHVAPRYIEQSGAEIGIPNMVTSVLASYRGFDTFGEVAVIFTAGIGVLSLLMLKPAPSQAPLSNGARHHTVLRIVSKILIPPILLFALYVQFHGDYGPGGGFQAGVIFAAGIILYTMFFGVDVAQQVVSSALLRVLAAFGVLLYGSVGLVSMLNGGEFLNYSVLAENPITGQHIGILVIELGVGITVAAVMVMIFYCFAGQQNKQVEAEE